MSAWGQKQTCALQNVMSALHPIATVKANSSKRPCPLYPQKRTCAVHKLMSALGQKRTYWNWVRNGFLFCRNDATFAHFPIIIAATKRSGHFVAVPQTANAAIITATLPIASLREHNQTERTLASPSL